MAWFHKKLTDLISAFETKDWDTAADILHDHEIDLKQKQGKKANLEIREAAFHLSEYTKILSWIRRVINQEMWPENPPQNWPPADADRARILGQLKNAEKNVLEFERILKRLIKEGKFME